MICRSPQNQMVKWQQKIDLQNYPQSSSENIMRIPIIGIFNKSFERNDLEIGLYLLSQMSSINQIINFFNGPSLGTFLGQVGTIDK